MNIKLHQIGDKPSRFEFRLSKADVPKLEERFEFDSIGCIAELTQNLEAIMLHGSYTVSIKTGCDICLDPVVIQLEHEFDLVLVSEEGYDTPEGDVEISLKSNDVDFFDGQEIPLSGYFEDQLLLDLPFSIKCDEECLGICPDCGINRNQDNCRCSEKSGNNPFSVLGDLKE